MLVVKEKKTKLPNTDIWSVYRLNIIISGISFRLTHPFSETLREKIIFQCLPNILVQMLPPKREIIIITQ